MALVALVVSGCGDEAQTQAPDGFCEAGCPDVPLGSPCDSSAQCPQGTRCNRSFPGGYCEGLCGEGAPDGELCGRGQGVCVHPLGSEDGEAPRCLGACEFAQPGQCAHPQAACYPLASDGAGACGLLCEADADCLEGQRCDERGLCRAP